MQVTSLYTAQFMDHVTHPDYKYQMEDATCSHEGINPSCGDDLTFSVKLADDGTIEEAAYQGSGCAISQASADMMADLVTGKTPEEAIRLCKLSSPGARSRKCSKQGRHSMATSMFSTKGRYALRAMVDLATHDGWVSLGDVSERQNISRKYLEQVIALMHRAGYVESLRGKGGGYRLTRAPEDYTLGEILRAAEGSLAPVACLQCTNDEICPQVFDCPTVKVWAGLGHVTSEYLDSKTLADILPTGAGSSGSAAETLADPAADSAGSSAGADSPVE